MMRRAPQLLALLLLLAQAAAADSVTVGSKRFTESHVLAEITAQLLEQDGHSVERKLGLGGSLMVYQALKSGAIDVYPEYSGTIAQNILKDPGSSSSELHNALAADGLAVITELGFNNGYAIAVLRSKAARLELQTISDLAAQPHMRVAVSLEFLNRADGWPALSSHYQLPQPAAGIEHALAYAAIAAHQLDATDAYTTDGDIEAFDLVLLADDKDFFPAYDALLLGRQTLSAGVTRSLARLHNDLDDASMRRLNARASQEGLSPAQIARDYLVDSGLISADADAGQTVGSRTGTASISANILRNTGAHLQLTGIALALACLLAIPLALLLTGSPRLSAAVIYLAGLLQTIPSLALLALMIPLLGLGQLPAIVALFLYSLLPIIRNTLTGVSTVDPLLLQVADSMGLTRRQRLQKIEIPLAMPMILAGIKTAAIISIGTATLAAFVGGGGLGEPILTGLSLNDNGLILQGAIPAAGLAIITEFLFEWLERALIPNHLRQAGQ